MRWVLVYVRAAAPGGASAGRYGRCVTYVTWLGPELCLVARGGRGAPKLEIHGPNSHTHPAARVGDGESLPLHVIS